MTVQYSQASLPRELTMKHALIPPKKIGCVYKCISFIAWQIYSEISWKCLTRFKKYPKGFVDYVARWLCRKKHYIHKSQENEPLLFIGVHRVIWPSVMRIQITRIESITFLGGNGRNFLYGICIPSESLYEVISL